MYRFLEHTADARVECRGTTFDEILVSAAQALYALTLKETTPSVGESRAISVEGASPEDLLVRWLQELIFLLDTEGFVGVFFEMTILRDTQLDAHVDGFRCAPDARAVEVKSATYHDLALEHDGPDLVARFVLDL